MTLTLPDEEWLTILLALRTGASGHRVRHAADRDACDSLARRVNACIESAAGLRELVAKLPPVTPPASEPTVHEPDDPSTAGTWQAIYDLFCR